MIAKEGFSDTLDRSNISSLNTDGSESTNKCLESSSNNNLKNTLNDFKFFPCPALNSSFNQPQHLACPCHQAIPKESCCKKKKPKENTKSRWGCFQGKWPRLSYSKMKDKYYDSNSRGRRGVFRFDDYDEGIPREKRFGFHKSRIKQDSNGVTEKIEIYYFDHGNSAYYHTTDIPPILSTERFIEKSHSAATQFWAEIFGYVHVAISFITTFFLQFTRCILFSLIRPLTVGVIQLVADYFIKPFLSITFNGIIQPTLILIYNIATSIRDCCEPLAAALGFIIKEIAVLFRACRLVELNYHFHKNNDITKI